MEKERTELTNILLEAGTNELEVIEFSIGDNLYGINVAKVREIIRFPEEIIDVPNSHPSLRGLINLRDSVIPIIDLPKHLGKDMKVTPDKSLVIVSEFNKLVVGFWVDSVARIHRISWNNVSSPSELMRTGEDFVVAVVKIENKIVLLLDFEKITSDISPESGIQKAEVTRYVSEDVDFNRSDKTIFVAEDSTFIRDMIIDYLKTAGYKVRVFNNGKEAWDELLKIISSDGFTKIDDYLHLLISDIEMPVMDGLHLIKNITAHRELKKIPCVVFSSLISDELALKCKSVGAVAEISKPEIERLVSLVDKYVLK